MYPVSQAYKDAIMQPSRQFRGRLLIPKLIMNFTRNSIAYKQDGTQVTANMPRFETGKFGKAIMVEEGTVNLVKNPSFEGTTDWGQLNRTTEAGAFHGNYACKVTYNWNQYQIITGITSGQTYTISAYGKNGQGPAKTRINLRAEKSDGTLIQYWDILWDETNWTRKSLTVTAPAGTAQFRIYLTKGSGENNSATNYGYIDAVQLEAKSYATSFIDGTRAAETLTIPTAGVFVKGNWTKEFYFIPTSVQVVAGKTGYLWECYIDANNYYALKVGPNDKPYLEVKSNGTVYQTTITSAPVLAVDIPYAFAVRGNGSLIALFVNGSKISEVSYVEPVGTLPANQYLGCDHNGANHANGLIDDLRISSRARTDEEIAARYKEVMG